MKALSANELELACAPSRRRPRLSLRFFRSISSDAIFLSWAATARSRPRAFLLPCPAPCPTLSSLHGLPFPRSPAHARRDVRLRHSRVRGHPSALARRRVQVLDPGPPRRRRAPRVFGRCGRGHARARDAGPPSSVTSHPIDPESNFRERPPRAETARAPRPLAPGGPAYTAGDCEHAVHLLIVGLDDHRPPDEVPADVLPVQRSNRAARARMNA